MFSLLKKVIMKQNSTIRNHKSYSPTYYTIKQPWSFAMQKGLVCGTQEMCQVCQTLYFFCKKVRKKTQNQLQ